MNKLMIGIAVAVVVCFFGVPLAIVAALFGGGTGPNTCGIPLTDLHGVSPPAAGHHWNDGQIHIAETIIDVGIRKGVSQWGWTIAIATAMQESALRNLPNEGANNDHDSVGVFQQRPSQGWGTARQLTNPSYQAGKFYDKLATIPGWQLLPLTRAAQTVQRSSHPDAYAKWTEDAVDLVNTLSNTDNTCDTAAITELPVGFRLPAETPNAVTTAINWALAQLGTTYVFGGNCTDAHSADPTQHCDCSSLVQQAYHAAGIALPRITTDQVRTGAAVRGVAGLKPGDLVFIPGSDGTKAQPRHVGIYIGQGLIIQAPHTGDIVKISELSGWRNEIAKIRRIVK